MRLHEGWPFGGSARIVENSPTVGQQTHTRGAIMSDGGNKTEYHRRAQAGLGRPYGRWVQRESTADGGDAMATATTTTFGAWLRTQRKEQDLTQEALAERAGCSWEMVRKIEAGTARPSRQLAELLAAALDVLPA